MLRALAAVMVMVAYASSAQGQVPAPPVERLDRPGGSGLQPPEFRKPAPTPGLVAPIPDAAPPATLPGGLRVFVRRIRVSGSTVFGEEQLRSIVAPFENRELTSEDLDEVRHRVSLAYAGAGYINSGAVIPDQDVVDGVITLQAIEGRLTRIVVGGENRFRERFITERVARGAGPPLNVRTLQETIQILLQNPQIERVNAALAPGTQRGEAVLTMDVKEAKRWTAGFSVANNRSPSVGSVRSELSAGVRNLTGLGEALAFRIGHTHGLDDQAFSLAVPVTPADTLFSARIDRVRSRVIEPPFDIVDIRSESTSRELALAHPLYRTLRSTLSLGGALYSRDNATTLLGVPFSFTPGLTDGKAKVSAARLFGDWLDRTQATVFAARLTLSQGLRIDGATTSTQNTPDSQYTTLLAQVQWARRLAEDGRQIVMRADLQHARGELLPSEKFAIGGSETVRGYRENLIVRDSGWVASAEYRQPVARVPIAALKESDLDGQVSLAAFADFGRAWDYFGAPGRRFIWSVGPGVRWDVAEGISAQVYWGWRQKSSGTPGDTLQDRGVHFRLAAARAF